MTRTSEAKKKRNSYGPEFKVQGDLEAVRGVKTINGIAQEYGVHPVSAILLQLKSWMQPKFRQTLS